MPELFSGSQSRSLTMSATQLVFDFVFSQSKKMFKTVGKMDPTHQSTISREAKAVEMMNMARDLAVYIDEMDEIDDFEDEEEEEAETDSDDPMEQVEESQYAAVSQGGGDSDEEMQDTADSGTTRSPVPAALPSGANITGASPHEEALV